MTSVNSLPIIQFWPGCFSDFSLSNFDLFPLKTCKNTSTLRDRRMEGTPLWATKEMYFHVKALPDAGCLLHVPFLFSGIFAWRAGETFVACSCSDCRQNPHITLADLACSASCPFDTPIPCHDDSYAFCPLWAFVTINSNLLVLHSVLTLVHDCKALWRGQERLHLDFLITFLKYIILRQALYYNNVYVYECDESLSSIYLILVRFGCLIVTGRKNIQKIWNQTLVW